MIEKWRQWFSCRTWILLGRIFRLAGPMTRGCYDNRMELGQSTLKSSVSVRQALEEENLPFKCSRLMNVARWSATLYDHGGSSNSMVWLSICGVECSSDRVEWNWKKRYASGISRTAIHKFLLHYGSMDPSCCSLSFSSSSSSFLSTSSFVFYFSASPSACLFPPWTHFLPPPRYSPSPHLHIIRCEVQ